MHSKDGDRTMRSELRVRLHHLHHWAVASWAGTADDGRNGPGIAEEEEAASSNSKAQHPTAQHRHTHTVPRPHVHTEKRTG